MDNPKMPETAPEAQTTAPSVYIKKKEHNYSTLESVFAWLCLVLGYLFCHVFPPHDNPLGMLLVIIAVVISTVFVLIKKGARFDNSAVASVILAVVFAFSLLVTSDFLIRLLALACSASAYCYFVYTAFGNKLENGMSDLVIVDFVKALVLYPFRELERVFYAMFSGRKTFLKQALKIIAGLCIAVIPTAIVIALLSYDNGFYNLIDKLLSFLDNFNPFSHVSSLIVAVFFAMYVFGLYCASTDKNELNPITVDYCRKSAESMRAAPALTVISAFLPLIVVYSVFFVSQWQYYVSAFSGVLPEGISYAEYARSGFFELCAVSAINFLLLSAAALFMRRKGRAEKLILKIVAVIISLMSLILIGTAMSKMILYINKYGLTEKRVVSSWFMILLAVIFVLIILRQFIKKLRLISASAIASALMLLLLSLSSYNGIIANYNVDRYISGELEEMDVYALCDIGEAAVPPMIRLAEYWENVQPPEDASDYTYLVNELKDIRAELDESVSVTSFSIPSAVAHNKLDDYFKE